MTTALSVSHPGIEVDRIELVLRDDGTNRRARFRVRYAAGTGPATVFLKASDPEHAELNAATGGLFNEPRLFTADVDLPIDHPEVFAVRMDEDALAFVLVMEDVAARGGDPRDATRPLSVEQAVHGVRGLARLHRAFWGRRLDEQVDLAWVEAFRPWRGMRVGIDVGLRRTGDQLPTEVRSMTGQEIEAQWCRYLDAVNRGPATLLHGDAHIGNTYVLPGDGVGFLDWQVLRRGDALLDVGYFVAGAVTAEDRRAAERRLIDEYHRALELPDDARPSREELWLRYRASAAHGLALWMATAASDTWQRPEVSRVLALRYATAFAELGTAEAIDELHHRRPTAQLDEGA